jgi:ubiquinone/menaquinone biosynthesis C-methylase UbiE
MYQSTSSAQFWDRIAPKYSRDPIRDMPGYERTIERSLGYLNPSDHVLEIGCGTGLTALRIADAVVSMIATDASPGMIEIARDRASARTRRNIIFGVATPETLPYGDGAFDAVLAFNLLHLLDKREKAFAHAMRVLKPGGWFISKTPCLSEMNPLIRAAVPLMRAIGKAPRVAFFNAAMLEDEIVQAGFQVIERGRHGSRGKDARIFIVARKPIGESMETGQEPAAMKSTEV